VTSLSKHRRFCDSTPSPYLALAAQQQQRQPQSPQQQHHPGPGFDVKNFFSFSLMKRPIKLERFSQTSFPARWIIHYNLFSS
jgi:hypothetical protein